MYSMAERLGAWASGFDHKDAPAGVCHAAQRCIIDVTGVTLAGSAESVSVQLRNFALEEFGQGSCAIFGSANRGSASATALLNGAAAHALDFDDTCYQGIVHGSAVVWPAVLAAAQRENASGADVLSAFIAGVEVVYALGRALGDSLYYKGWWNTAVLGAIGAAAGAARVLGLDAVKAAHAISIAACQPAGLRAVFGTTAKPYICGRAAQLGLDAAFAVRAGLTGPERAFEGQGGFATVLNDGGIDTAAAIETLGERFALISPGIAFKLYPACSATLAAIEAAKEILQEDNLDRGAVEEVICEVTPLVDMCLVYPKPKTVNEAQFSLPFTVGSVLAIGEFSLNQLSLEALRDERLQAAMSKVNMVRSEDLTATEDEKRRYPEAARVTIIMKDGRRYQRFKGAALGMPVNPASDGRLDEKFHACAERIVSPKAASDLLSRLKNIAELDTARDIWCSGFPRSSQDENDNSGQAHGRDL
jgi:2-methylcitrate dehydratase PrpD